MGVVLNVSKNANTTRHQNRIIERLNK